MAEGEVYEVESSDDVEYTPDGGAIVKIGDDERERPDPSFYENIAPNIDDLDDLCLRLLQDIDRDRKARQRRDQEYAEAIRRTGLGDEAPGGAKFEGASRVVHPMLTEAVVDFASRAIKELMPPNGPVKMYVPGDNPEPSRFVKGERVKNYMNWQFLTQMPDFRSELEQLLTQLPLGGSQYLKLVHDRQKKRPVPTYWPSDDVYLPYSASNFYTADRVTFVEHITEHEFQMRVSEDMYLDLGKAATATVIEDQSEAEKATEKVEGKEPIQAYNEDGLRNEYEVQTWCELEDDYGYAPYRITIDGAHRKVVAVNRNWEERDETKQSLYWSVEFPFIPWRGAYSIGLGQMIGSLSGGATGALRALLDSAHINNIPTLLKLKGVNFMGQSKELRVAEVTELDGAVIGDDIRKLVMNVPFNPPSETLLALLGVLTDAGRGVVQTTFEKLGEQSHKELPVGTTLALLEEGLTVFSAIHLRLFQAMDRVLRILSRINRMYLDEEEAKDDLGTTLAYRRDFDPPHDIVPVADPEIFSDVQRMAQLQVIADRAAQMPEVYNVKAVEKRILERTKIPNPDELLLPDDTPEEQNAVNENASMSLGRPVAAFPEQDHLAHLQVHLDYVLSPIFGQSPVIAPTLLPMMLEHIKEHMALYYARYNYDLLQASTGLTDEALSQVMQLRDPEVRRGLDKNLAIQSHDVMPAIGKVFNQFPDIIAQMIQQIQAMQPKPEQPPVDPTAVMAIQQEQQSDELRATGQHESNVIKLIEGREKRAHEKELKVMELDADQRQELLKQAREDARQATEYAARLEQLMEQERAEDERLETELEVRRGINEDDNETALEIADRNAKTESSRAGIRTGEGSTNPRPRQRS